MEGINKNPQKQRTFKVNGNGQRTSGAGTVGGVLSRLDNSARTDADPQNADKFAVYTYPGAGTITQVAHPAVSGGLTVTYGSDGDCAGRDRFGRPPKESK